MPCQRSVQRARRFLRHPADPRGAAGEGVACRSAAPPWQRQPRLVCRGTGSDRRGGIAVVGCAGLLPAQSHGVPGHSRLPTPPMPTIAARPPSPSSARSSAAIACSRPVKSATSEASCRGTGGPNRARNARAAPASSASTILPSPVRMVARRHWPPTATARSPSAITSWPVRKASPISRRPSRPPPTRRTCPQPLGLLPASAPLPPPQRFRRAPLPIVLPEPVTIVAPLPLPPMATLSTPLAVTVCSDDGAPEASSSSVDHCRRRFGSGAGRLTSGCRGFAPLKPAEFVIIYYAVSYTLPPIENAPHRISSWKTRAGSATNR